jgi:hypothetical protein
MDQIHLSPQVYQIQLALGHISNIPPRVSISSPDRIQRPSTNSLFAWLISHQPAVLFSQNKPATSNQPAVLFSQNKSAPAISHQPNEQAGNGCTPFGLVKEDV